MQPDEWENLKADQKLSILNDLGQKWARKKTWRSAYAKAAGIANNTISSWRRDPHRIPFVHIALLIEWSGERSSAETLMLGYARAADKFSEAAKIMRHTAIIARGNLAQSDHLAASVDEP